MITHLHTVAIPVTDQDRAVDFYKGTLGFEPRYDAELQPGMRWIEVAPPGAVTSVALVPPSTSPAHGIDTGIRLITTDADGDHAALAARGVDVGELLRWEGVPPMFAVRDPDGNTLYMVEAD
jgi:catechol 2,3-dioxygenase-like lactoylglutathione lyase family enzyme